MRGRKETCAPEKGAPLTDFAGGRGGIRTHGTEASVHRISNPAHSTTLPPFRGDEPSAKLGLKTARILASGR